MALRKLDEIKRELTGLSPADKSELVKFLSETTARSAKDSSHLNLDAYFGDWKDRKISDDFAARVRAEGWERRI